MVTEILKKDWFIGSPYCHCYCEENIYLLTRKFMDSCDFKSLFVPYVLFISSQSQHTPIWFQKSSKSIESPVLWDYHVCLIVLARDETKSLVYDMDTILTMPCNLSEYITKSFKPFLDIPEKHQQKFRVVPGIDFLEYFASDRSHMADSIAKPPDWPLIKGSKVSSSIAHNLFEYVSMSTNNSDQIGLGKVYTLKEFLEWSHYDNISSDTFK